MSSEEDRRRQLLGRMEEYVTTNNSSKVLAEKEARWRALWRQGFDTDVAFIRVEVERLCRLGIFLPREGLELLRQELVGHGFYFGSSYKEHFISTLFPPGWRLIPSPEFNKENTDRACYAYLMSPENVRIATVYYHINTVTTDVRIMPYA